MFSFCSLSAPACCACCRTGLVIHSLWILSAALQDDLPPPGPGRPDRDRRDWDDGPRGPPGPPRDRDFRRPPPDDREVDDFDDRPPRGRERGPPPPYHDLRGPPSNEFMDDYDYRRREYSQYHLMRALAEVCVWVCVGWPFEQQPMRALAGVCVHVGDGPLSSSSCVLSQGCVCMWGMVR